MHGRGLGLPAATDWAAVELANEHSSAVRGEPALVEPAASNLTSLPGHLHAGNIVNWSSTTIGPHELLKTLSRLLLNMVYNSAFVCLCVCVRACVRACVRVCVCVISCHFHAIITLKIFSFAIPKMNSIASTDLAITKQ